MLALIVGDGSPGEAEAAVAAAGGETPGRLGWDAAADDIRGDVVLVEARGAAADALADALPRVCAAAEALDLPVVVALDEAQIDLVAGAMLGARNQLLCEPTAADRVVALTLAAAMQAGVDGVREDDRERLVRLGAEVARIAELLARLGRRAVPAPDSLADRSFGFETPPVEPAERVEAADIRRLIRTRRLRDRSFAPGLFEDPAWDMMLDLFAAHLEQADVSVSSLCIAAAVAPTTALRWIGRMVDAGLFARHPDPLDRRRALVTLSRPGLQAMYAHVAATRAQGLPLA